MAYEINININGDIDEESTAKGVSKTKGTSEDEKQEKAQKRLAKYVSSQTIQPFIQEVKSAISQDIQLITGNDELQQRVNFAFQTVQFGVNTYKNAQAGAIVSTAMGAGAGVGAVLGIALTALNTAMQIGFNQLQINLRSKIENYQLQQTRTRQGIAYNRSRRGDNGI